MESLDINVLNQIPKGEIHYDRLDPEYFAKLKNDIAENGIKEPLTLQYFIKNNALRLGEGHHRLHIANELGIELIPVNIIVNWHDDYYKYKHANTYIDDNKIYNPPKPLDVEGYKRRNYQPTFIKPHELGFNSVNESHIKKFILLINY